MFPIRPVSAAAAVVVLAGAVGAEAYADQGAASEARPSARASLTRVATHPGGRGARVADSERLCDKLSDCQFVETGQPSTGWSSWQILGGQVDNCSPTTTAKYEAEISDERGESNSTMAGFSARASAAILGLAKASLELKVSSKQMGEVSTTTSRTTEVNIGPEEKASVDTRVWTATVHFEVKDLVHNIVLIPDYQVNLPGFKLPTDDVYNGDAVQFRTNHAALSQDEKNACHALTP